MDSINPCKLGDMCDGNENCFRQYSINGEHKMMDALMDLRVRDDVNVVNFK